MEVAYVADTKNYIHNLERTSRCQVGEFAKLCIDGPENKWRVGGHEK